jgi:hypothetical protein
MPDGYLPVFNIFKLKSTVKENPHIDEVKKNLPDKMK